MLKLTLEWNAVTTLEDSLRAGRESLLKIVQAHSKIFDVGIVTTAASENTARKEFPATAKAFLKRLDQANLSMLTRVKTKATISLTYIDHSFIPFDDRLEELVMKLWAILPGSIPRSYKEFARVNKIPEVILITAPSYQKWRNHWCDVHSMLAHIIAKRDVFVTGDVKNFKGDRKKKLKALGIGDIYSYDETWEKYGD